MTIATVEVTNANTTLYTATGSDLVTSVEITNNGPVLANNTLAPPSEVTGDIYRLDTTAGGIHANWDTAALGETMRFDGATWQVIAANGVSVPVTINLHKIPSGQAVDNTRIVERALTISEGDTFVYDVVSFLVTGDFLNAISIDATEDVFGQADLITGTAATTGTILKATVNVRTPQG